MIYFLSDLHFGIRNSNEDWFDIQKKYFFEFFIPQIKTKNNSLIICGDVFDNRTNLNIKIMNEVINIFDSLLKIFDNIYINIGNHDIYNKSTNGINSLKILNNDKIKIFETPTTVKIENKLFLFVPWIDNYSDFKNALTKADYLISHTEYTNLFLNKSVKVQDGVDVKDIKKYKYAFNGHIHINQQQNNLINVGSPYHLNKNDIDNIKGFYVLNGDKLDFIENTYSPKFIKINYKDYSEKQIKEMSINNFVDVCFASDQKNINDIILSLTKDSTSKNITFVTEQIKDDEMIEVSVDDEFNNFNILKIIEKFIDSSEYKNKDVILEKINKLYKKVSS